VETVAHFSLGASLAQAGQRPAGPVTVTFSVLELGIILTPVCNPAAIKNDACPSRCRYPFLLWHTARNKEAHSHSVVKGRGLIGEPVIEKCEMIEFPLLTFPVCT
jgi:hypothetical protein